MLNVQLLFVFGIILNFALARPNDSPPTLPVAKTVDTLTDTDNNENVVKIPVNGVVYGLIVNFTSSSIELEPDQMESVTLKDDNYSTNTNGGKLVRKKRFLFGIIGTAFQSLRSDNWRECGRTPWGTTIYTNGIATACFGACPENVYCGYGYDGYGYGYRHQVNNVYFG